MEDGLLILLPVYLMKTADALLLTVEALGMAEARALPPS